MLSNVDIYTYSKFSNLKWFKLLVKNDSFVSRYENVRELNDVWKKINILFHHNNSFKRIKI